jgi:threonine/homoserine/homoserine lactone efflux protein
MYFKLYWSCIEIDYKVYVMNWQEFTALVVLATAMSFSPGPNTTLSTAMAANHGLRHALRFVCAVPVGWGLLLSGCVFGLGALLLAVPVLTAAVKAIGVGYLLFMAFKLFNWGQIPMNSPNRLMVKEDKLNISFIQGVAMQFVNIKAWMLALSIVSGWIAGRANPGERFAIVLPLMLGFAFFSNLTYALIGALLKNWLAGPDGSGARLMWFNRAMALVLMLTAVWMATI